MPLVYGDSRCDHVCPIRRSGGFLRMFGRSRMRPCLPISCMAWLSATGGGPLPGDFVALEHMLEYAHHMD